MESLAAVSKREHSKKTGLEREACSLQTNNRDNAAEMLSSLCCTYRSDLLWI